MPNSWDLLAPLSYLSRFSIPSNFLEIPTTCWYAISISNSHAMLNLILGLSPSINCWTHSQTVEPQVWCMLSQITELNHIIWHCHITMVQLLELYVPFISETLGNIFPQEHIWELSLSEWNCLGQTTQLIWSPSLIGHSPKLEHSEWNPTSLCKTHSTEDTVILLKKILSILWHQATESKRVMLIVPFESALLPFKNCSPSLRLNWGYWLHWYDTVTWI